MSWERRIVTAGGLETSYLEAGDPGRRTILLLHDGAFGSDAESCWGAAIDTLAHDHHVVAPDLLGYGASRKIVAFDRDPLGYRLEHAGQMCAALELSDVIVIGSSLGGGLAMRAAASRALPMVAGVSISGPGGVFMNFEAMGRLQVFEPTEAWSRMVCESMRRDPSAEEIADRLTRAAVPGHYESLASTRITSPIDREPPPDWREGYKRGLATVDVPILLVAGDEDPLLDTDWASQLAAIVPTARVEVIAGGRHMPHLDHLEEVAAAIGRFLDDSDLGSDMSAPASGASPAQAV